MARRDSLLFSSFSFFLLLLLSLSLFLLSRSRKNDAITNKRDNRGSPLRVRFTSAPLPFSSPARGMSLSPSSALVRLAVPLPIFLSLSLSLSRRRERAHFLIRSSRAHERAFPPCRAHERKLVEAATRAREISRLRRTARAVHRISRCMIDVYEISFLSRPLSFSFSFSPFHWPPLRLYRDRSLTISRSLWPSLSRHSALRLSGRKKEKNSSGRWPPPASHRFRPLSHGALFRDRPPRLAPRSRCTRSSAATTPRREDDTISTAAATTATTTMTTRQHENDDTSERP